MIEKHLFKQGPVRSTCCHKFEDGSFCNKKAKTLIHKMKHSNPYKPGEVVGRYIVQANGSFKLIKEDE